MGSRACSLQIAQRHVTTTVVVRALCTCGLRGNVFYGLSATLTSAKWVKKDSKRLSLLVTRARSRLWHYSARCLCGYHYAKLIFNPCSWCLNHVECLDAIVFVNTITAPGTTVVQACLTVRHRAYDGEAWLTVCRY